MKHVIEHLEKCKSCGGTGLYVGMAEHDGAAVVCSTCKGIGRVKFHYEYEDYEGRVKKQGVKRVFQTNPGICIGEGNGHKLDEFGGMSVEDWESGKQFTAGMENRNFTCPAWWYQCADYTKKPDWSECNKALGCRFSECSCFKNKSSCWERWDKEIGSKVKEETKG